MKIAKVPAVAKIDELEIPCMYVFFFPEKKKDFTLLELKTIIKEMEKMEKWQESS